MSVSSKFSQLWLCNTAVFGMVIALTLFFLLMMALAIQELLWFHIKHIDHNSDQHGKIFPKVELWYLCNRDNQ